MAFLGIKVPDEVGKLLYQISVPGLKVSRDNYHISLLIFEKNMTINQIVMYVPKIHEIVNNYTSPLHLYIEKVGSFPKGEGGYPVICRVDSENNELVNFQQVLREVFDTSGLEYDKTYEVYKPHVMLSRANKELGSVEIPRIDFTINELVLWGGDSLRKFGEDNIVIKFPMKLNKDKSIKLSTQFKIALELSRIAKSKDPDEFEEDTDESNENKNESEDKGVEDKNNDLRLSAGPAFYLQPNGLWTVREVPIEVVQTAHFSGHLTVMGYLCATFEVNGEQWAQKMTEKSK